MAIKYIVKAGHVRSTNDSDSHYVSCDELVRLFNVKRSECIYYNHYKHRFIDTKDLIVLSPRRDGRYEEYKETMLRMRKL